MEEVKDKGPCSGVNSLHRPTLSLCTMHSPLFHSAFTALHCIIAQYTVLHCTILHCPILCDAVLQPSAPPHSFTLCTAQCAVLHCIVKSLTLSLCAVLFCIRLNSKILHWALCTAACKLHFVSFSFGQSQSKGIVCFPESWASFSEHAISIFAVICFRFSLNLDISSIWKLYCCHFPCLLLFECSLCTCGENELQTELIYIQSKLTSICTIGNWQIIFLFLVPNFDTLFANG